MIPIEGQPILTVAQMRAAEERAIAAGSSVQQLMERAGAGVAEAAHRLAAGAPILVLCGSGNNGGDGYVAARVLKSNGVDVRVAALSEPSTDAAKTAREGWTGPVVPLVDAERTPVVVDAVLGNGWSRNFADAEGNALVDLINGARLSLAVDLPSGLPSKFDDALFVMYKVDITLALGAVKPFHVLQPFAENCGTVRVLDIGLDLMDIPVPEVSRDWVAERPWIAGPYNFSHKYSRGMVIVIGGEMTGAAALAAEAAMHAGAGYSLLFEDDPTVGPPHALVRRRWSKSAFEAATKGKSRGSTAIVVGPGLGKDEAAAGKLKAAIASGIRLVIDGDALHLLDDEAFARFHERPPEYPVVLTPHEGEFKALFGDWSGSKIDAARDAAMRSGAIVVFKGNDTVIAYPDGRTRTAPPASAWLSTAGTGDVLAGTIGAMLTATTLYPAETGVWMHAEAALRLGGAFIADDLVRELSAVRASL